MKILFVEDNANAARAMKAMLEMRGYSVGTSGSVANALHSLSTTKYDLLISDINLPDGTGYDIVAKAPRALKAIALSGYAAETDREKALASGFTSFLAKPFRIDELIAEIEKA